MAIPVSIEEFLGQNRVPYSVLHHPLAYTAQEEAALAHVPGREWAKTVACVADGEPILAVLPAPYKVDLDCLCKAAGARHACLATESDIAPLYPDCELGAMPPFGPLYHERVFVDRSLARSQEIAFNAGTHTDAIRMRYEDFDRLVHPLIADFGRSPKMH